MAQTRRGCGAFLTEAQTRLGTRHPLTPVHLGEGHPTVRDARTLLAVLRSAGAG
ncbi:hypothetical protein ACFV2H_43250 [Streptomyces sp. NPDC059629]|uniref:hypothetical protein n=1 Tax=Streptomyces sp. NPDC059629 TaxID=3346889 RepID=UPI0036A472C1